jgi:ankyrin repeat protein
MFKLAIDNNNLVVFKVLSGSPDLEIERVVSRLATVLEHAAMRGRVEMMSLLQDCGIDIDGDDYYHSLGAAAAGGSLDAVKWLIESGADPCEKDRVSVVKEYAQTPVVIAARHGHVKILPYLSSAGTPLGDEDPDYDALHIAMRDRRPGMLVCLLQSGVRFEVFDPPMEKGLEIAVEQDDAELARLLLQAGADPNAEETCVAFRYVSGDEQEHYDRVATLYGTLFQWACAQGLEDVARAFLDHDVDFDKQIKSWANWQVNKTIYVAYSCRNMGVARAILEYYDGAELVHLVADLVRKGNVFLLKELAEYDEVKRKVSWLLKRCFLQIHSLMSTFSAYEPDPRWEHYAETIKLLIEMGAWLPPDRTWHFLRDLLHRLDMEDPEGE